MVKVVIDTVDWDLVLRFTDTPFRTRANIAWQFIKRCRKPTSLLMYINMQAFAGSTAAITMAVQPGLWCLLLATTTILISLGVVFTGHEGLVPLVWNLLRGRSEVYVNYSVSDGRKLFFVVMLLSEAGYERVSSVMLHTTELEIPMKEWIERHIGDYDIDGFGSFQAWRKEREDRLSWATRIKARCQ